MTTENEEQVSDIPTNALDLSDEEFNNLNFDDFVQEHVEVEESADLEDTDVNEVVDDESEDSGDGNSDEEDQGTSEEEEDSEDTEETSEDESEEEVEKESDTSTEDDEEGSSDPDEESESTIDYKQAYEQLTKPFKANGREIKVDNVDDAITLMQMGANYNKKMAGLKPNLKLLKMLENNKLLDEDKLNYLIDLDKKNPEAIKKLVKDSGVDPLDIDTKAPSEYKPNTYNVNDQAVELDEILDEIRDTKTFSETLDVVSNKWDNSSRQVLYDNPDVIKIINNHIESGIYQQINTIVESERMLGRLKGMSDIEAYKYVGDAINAQGGFKESSSNPAPTNAPKKANSSTVDPKLKAKKKAASSTKSSAGKTIDKQFDPLSMSDEEFEKLDASKFM